MPILILDLDGTLLDVRERYAHSLVNTLSRLGYLFTMEQISPPMKSAFALDIDKFLEALGISLSQEELVKYFISIEREFYKAWSHSFVIPGAIEALHEVRPRVDALRLITSRAWVEETRQEVKIFELDKVFGNHIYTRGDLAREEGVNEVPLLPFQEQRQRLIQLAIADIETKDSVWVVGDSLNEMQTVQSLNYTAVGVLTGFFSREDLDPVCDYVIKSVADITTLL